jgi:hypothetical protein
MRLTPTVGLCLAVVIAAPLAGEAKTRDPELFNVFTPRIIESFQQVTETSAEMETRLSSTLDQLTKQITTYDESGCLKTGIEDQDIGCLEQFRALRGTYTAFLEELRVSLPEIESTIGFATTRMKSNIQKSASQASPATLWESLKGREPAQVPGRGPLSNRMKRILDAIHQRGSQVSPAELSLEIYADLAATEEIIVLIQAAVMQQEMLMQLPDEVLVGHGTEFADTIGKVQLAIFGEDPVFVSESPEPEPSEIPTDWGG